MGYKTIGVILLNLGGPDNLEAVRPFLYNLFSDRDIIRLGPAFLQRPLAWTISTLRAGKSISMYRQIGGGSPILRLTQRQAEGLNQRLGERYRVFIGMRYWRPYIKETVREMYNEGIRDVIALSMYPHYSIATTGSASIEFERAADELRLNYKYVQSWKDNPYYITALSALIEKGLTEFDGRCRDVLFSAHSLPVDFIERGDPYVEHINMTIDRLKRDLLDRFEVRAHLSYQSRSGPARWLTPSTEDKITELAKDGIRDLLITPISFVSDHIETLYEIDILYKKITDSCGITMRRTEALNDHPLFIECLYRLVMGVEI